MMMLPGYFELNEVRGTDDQRIESGFDGWKVSPQLDKPEISWNGRENGCEVSDHIPHNREDRESETDPENRLVHEPGGEKSTRLLVRHVHRQLHQGEGEPLVLDPLLPENRDDTIAEAGDCAYER